MKRDHILQEIKRTAEENGGKPLGWRRFASEIGIRYNDWCGKYWVRWNDALRDAGFGPNVLTAAYDDGVLLEKLAQFARELGHLPVAGELRMKARESSGFPHDRPFRRFGGKANIVKRLREHCVMLGEYDDVVRMCDAYAPPVKAAPEDGGERDVTVGFVYLIKSGKFYKIGRSYTPGRRQYDLAIQLPEKVKVIHTIPTEAPEAAERFWHERFKVKRKGGEWFDLTATDVKAFRRCKSM